MTRVGRLLVLLLVPGLLLVGCNEGDDEGGDFEVELSGAEEVCEEEGSCGGDGSGTANIEINSDRNEVCYELSLEGMENVTAAHIHAAPEGQAGDPVVDFAYEGDDSGGEGCVEDVEESVLEEISEEPERHYVNVHTEEYPDGAARAQLAG